jgi:hypothetical protein
MTARIRAKFQCQEEKQVAWAPGSRQLKFQAVYDPDLPEDQKFAKYTPVGTLEMTVDNPAAQFTLGAQYYLDFTLVDNEATPAPTEVAEPF